MKLALRKSIGLSVGDHEVALSVAAQSPLGWVEAERHVEPCTPEQLDATLKRLLEPWVDRRRGRTHWPVTLGIPALRVYYTTRPVPPTATSPQALLQEMLQSTNAGGDDMVIDSFQSTPGKRPLITLASCRRKYLSSIVNSALQHGAKLTCAEPAPCALLRSGGTLQKAPRGAKLVARFFLGHGQALGVLTTKTQPLLWRLFDLPAGAEPAAILAALSALRMLARPCGIGLPIDAVIVHGRPDLGALFDPAEFQKRADAPLLRCDEPGLDPGSIAFGLALGGAQMEETLDLAREFKPRAPLREVIPWAELATQVSLLFIATALLWHADDAVNRQLASVQARTAKFRWLGTQMEGPLVKDKKALEQRLEAVETFMSSRIDWREHTRAVAGWLPENVKLTSIQGMGELAQGGPKAGPAPKKSLILSLSTPVPEHDAIEACLAALRSQPRLKRDFPQMKLADLKFLDAKEPVATFSVVCLPDATATAAAKPGGPGTKAAPKAKGG